MSKQPKPASSPWLTPYLIVRDPRASLEFCHKAFGFEPGMSMPDPSGAVVHADMSYRGETVAMFGKERAWGGTAESPVTSGVESPVGLYVYCEDVDALFAQARQAGATVVGEPEDMFWGDRVAQLRDPDGHSWSFATRVGELDPSKMPW